VDPVRYQRIKELFVAAQELPPADRDAFLATVCGSDHELRAEVESLLRYDAQDDFLEPPIGSTLPSGSSRKPGSNSAAFDTLIGSTFGPYHVMSRLGSGGMGVVYVAEDTRLGRRAALKFLRRDLSVDEDAKARFIREARAVAALDHPNICTLYGIDHTSDQQMFLAMAYYQGETLKQRLANGRLPLSVSIDIARQIGAGLAAAHAAGVVHRDVKPGNIMLSDPLVKILDFGIAKLTSQTTLTVAGLSLGTAAYMSPEQAEGGAVDHRTDVWALGVVLFEMVTGQRPFDVDSFSGVAHVAHSTPLRRPRELRPEIPINLENCIVRALSLNPADRFQSMRDVVAALEGVRPSADAASQVLIIAATNAPSTAEGMLTQAICEAFVDTLSVAGSLTVLYQPDATIRTERLSVAGYGVSLERAPRVSIESTLSQNGMVAIAATMMNAGHVVDEWKADEHVSELPRLLGRIACGVASSLGVRLSADEERTLTTQRSVSPQSYLAYLKGRWQLSQGTETWCQAALASFEEACTGAGRDPRSHAGIVEASIALIETRCAASRDQLGEKARAALARAIDVDATDPDVLFAAAEAAYRLDWSLAAAESRLRQLLAVRSGHWRARLRLAECLVVTGKFSDAIGMAKDVAERQPFSPRTLLRVGRVLYFARDYDEAARVFTAVVERVPDSVIARFDLSLTLAKTGESAHARAREECDRALSRREGEALMIAALGNAARARGITAAYESAARMLRALHDESPVSACCFGILEAAFGDTDRPLEYWDAYDETMGLAKFVGFAPVQGSLSMYLDAVGLIAYFGLDPAFESLREASALRALRLRLQS
jgi:serine/threonine protein kinase/tetratricopeptide (TPR) repeat protein